MNDNILRYIRQTALHEIGIIGQKKLLSSKVLIVGAGALGSPAAIYLASAGVGTIGIADDDKVQLENLHRQILYKTASVGKTKVESARETIKELNPEINIKIYNERISETNAGEIFQNYDITIDCTDNFESRYVINKACVKLGLPMVHGSILRFEGQVSVFNKSPCYSCLYPEPPPAEISPTCARAGVLGAVTGIIGTMQALEAIKLICGFGEPLIGKLLIFDALTCTMRLFEVKKDEKCKVCNL